MRTLLAIPWLAPLRDGIPTPANGSRRRPTVAPLRFAIPWLAPLRDGIPTPANGSRRRPTVAPLRFAIGLLLTFGPATTRAEAPSRFEVPERVEVRDEAALDAADTPTHELILLADVVARPGETPAEALSRALHGEERVAQR